MKIRGLIGNTTRRQFLTNTALTGASVTMLAAPTMLLFAAERDPAIDETDLPPKYQSAAIALKQAHATLWSKFIDRDGILIDFVGELPKPEDCSMGRPNALGWWSPIENGPMLTGLYLPAACERARRSQSPIDRANAKQLVHGLMKCASTSDVKGFIARGFGTDGRCHYPLGSDDQTHPWFYGLYAYLKSGIPTPTERAQILKKMNEVADALQETSWNCPADGSFKGQFRGSFTGATFRDAARYLYMLRVMYELTHDAVWLDRYHEAYAARPKESALTRGEICAGGVDFDPSAPSLWIYVGSQGALAKLAEWETDESVRARFREGLASGAKRTLPFCLDFKKFDNNDTKVFGNVDWRAGYPTWFLQKTPEDAVRLSQLGDKKKLGERKTYEMRYMRNPLAAAAIVALAGDVGGRDAIEKTISHYDYSKLYISQFLFAECAYYALASDKVG